MKTTTGRRAIAGAAALSVAVTAVSAALAAAPPIAVDNEVSPPARVGRLARITGAVSFHTADQTAWSPAVINYPITTGNALWTEPSADAQVEISGNRLAMDGATELDIATLDDHVLAASEPQGDLYLHLRQVTNGDTYTIQTPRGAVQIPAAGRYEVAAGDSDHPTTVTVVEGTAQVTGGNLALQVGAGQTASIDGATSFQGAVGPMRQDAFLTKMLAQERPAPRAAVAVPPVVSQMTGSSDLDQYGSWADTPQNGSVWYPQVESGWVPYRHGRWSYVAPWGWTWVDDAPWGFAPFHYGRWIETDHRWGWIPADPAVQAYPAPVYAPALVSWVDIGAAAAGSAAAGAVLARGGGRSVGWVPLGPSEPYYPPYSHALNYVRAVNGPSIRNVNMVINTVNNRTVVQNFVNRGAATVVPAGVMAQSAPIAAAARPIAPQDFARARSQVQAPVAPTAATAGVTPAVARQFNFAPPVRPATAGPPINPAAFRPAGPRGAAAAFVPPIRPSGAPAAQPAAAAAQAVPSALSRQDNTAPALAAPSVPAPQAGPASRPEPMRPGEPTAGPPPPRPGAAVTPEVARPGVLPEIRSPGSPVVEPSRPTGTPSPGSVPAVAPREPARPAPIAEPGRPSPAAVAPARPGLTAEPARPAPVVETPRPVPTPAPQAPRAAPPRPAAAAQPTRPPEPRPLPRVQAPRPEPPRAPGAAAPAPHPAAPPRPVAAPFPPARPAPPQHPGPREERH